MDDSQSNCDPQKAGFPQPNLVKEGGLVFHIGKNLSESQDCDTSSSPHLGKSLESLDKNGSGFFNPAMVVYRDFIVLTSKLLYKKQIEFFIKFKEKHDAIKTLDEPQSTFHFADPFSGCGPLPIRIMTELVKTRKEINEKCNSSPHESIECTSFPQFPIQVSANDLSEDCKNLIETNGIQNGLINLKLISDESKKFSISSKDANLFLHTINSFKNDKYKPASHIHLDPFGCCTPYLDSAMSALDIQVKNEGSCSGVLSLTATDIGVLYDRRYTNNCRRHYNILHLEKKRSNNFREQAVRIVLYAIASSAGRVRDAGIKKVLYAFPYAHFILVAVEIDYKSKNETISKLKMSKTNEGPFYMGELFDGDFICDMKQQIKKDENVFSKETYKILEKILSNDCFYRSKGSKVITTQTTLLPWFLCLPDLSKRLGLASIPKKHKIISYMQEKGYIVTGTVFDPNSIKLGGVLNNQQTEETENEEEVLISKVILEMIAENKNDRRI